MTVACCGEERKGQTTFFESTSISSVSRSRRLTGWALFVPGCNQWWLATLGRVRRFSLTLRDIASTGESRIAEFSSTSTIMASVEMQPMYFDAEARLRTRYVIDF